MCKPNGYGPITKLSGKNAILDIDKTDIEEVEPDEWDLKMIADAKASNGGSTISLDELLKKEGLTYADL